MWHHVWLAIWNASEWIKIVVTLGALEILLWVINSYELKEQTQILEEIAVTLSIREGQE